MKKYPMKKSAFSYLELIISMGLVVMVVFLTTPFLTHMEKNTTAKFGEYRAYAKFVKKDDLLHDFPKFEWTSSDNEDWVLFQNVRRGAAEYNMDQEAPCPLNEDKTKQICAFILPNKVTNYKVHLYGAGGEGSRPYYDEYASTESMFSVSKGMGGTSGQFVTKIDSLTRAITNDDDTIVRFYKCSDIFMDNFNFMSSEKINGDEPKNCIGTRSYGNTRSTNPEDIYSNDIREDIKKRFLLGKFDESKLALARRYFSPEIVQELNNYLKAKNSPQLADTEKELFDKLKNKEWTNQGSAMPYNINNVGYSGGDTFFTFDDSNAPVIAFGGKGGITYKDRSEEYQTNEALSLDEFVGTSNDFYKTGSKYIITGTQGAYSNAGSGGVGGDCLNAAKMSSSDYCQGSSPIVFACSKNDKQVACSTENPEVFHFGAGGGGGAIRIDSENSSYPEIYDGGRGAGGAVVIEWN